VSLFAQQPAPAVTAADCARAEKMLAPALAGLVVGGSVTPTWLPVGCFWYRTTLVDGSKETILVDPAREARAVCTPAVSACAGLAVPGRRLIAGATSTRERQASGGRSNACLSSGHAAARSWLARERQGSDDTLLPLSHLTSPDLGCGISGIPNKVV
jgi:hypothetical protein